MAVLDVSFFNPKVRASTGINAGVLLDQISIKENQLKVDGNLSAADYESLAQDTQKLLALPGLSAGDRSNIQVKLSQYQAAKSNKALDQANDIPRLNREADDDFRKINMLFSNNPGNYLQSKADVLQAKLERLTDSIESLDISGADSSNHVNEFNEALSEYNDTLQALNDVQSHKPGVAPTSNYTAYITTNAQGEIQDITVGRVGSKTGYVETNGLYGGLPIYGKVNRKESGKNIFILGNEIFSGSDLTIQDPNIPGSFRSAPLLSSDVKQGKNVGVVIQSYKDIDLNSVRPQGSLRSGQWAEGINGNLYQKLDNGKYVKYINADKKKLNIQDGEILRVPSLFESNINNNVFEVKDGASIEFSPLANPSYIPAVGATGVAPSNVPSPSPQVVPPAPGGTPRTPEPTSRAPVTAPGIAQRALGAARGFLSSIFNR